MANSCRRLTTPLVKLCFSGTDEEIEALTQEGVDINEHRLGGLTALHTATMLRRASVVSLLIRAGANVDAVTDDNSTALYFAVNQCFPEIAEILIAAGANVNLANNQGFSPLYSAVVCGRDVMTRMLLSAGADIFVCRQEGDSLIHYIQHHEYESVDELLRVYASTLKPPLDERPTLL